MNASIKDVQLAYEEDVHNNIQAVTEDQLPLSYEAISSEWLTAILCRDVAGAAVTAHRLGASDSGSTNRRKIYLRYNAAGQEAGLPESVFCKATQDLSNRIVLGVCGGSLCETIFYKHIRPFLDVEIPVARFALFDPKTFNSMIVLDDLTHRVQEFCNHKTVMTRQRAESQMRLLGRMHGQCYVEGMRTRLECLPTFKEYFAKTLRFGMREGSDKGFIASEEFIPARLFNQFDRLWSATLASIDALDRAPYTLAHGDVHLKNWYVVANGEMGLGDWACAARAQWGRDFAYTISTALTVENRRAWERELLTYYLEERASAGGPRISFDAAWTSYRQQLITAMTWWTTTLCPPPDLPDMQPREVTIEFIKRIGTAMDDLDSLSV